MRHRSAVRVCLAAAVILAAAGAEPQQSTDGEPLQVVTRAVEPFSIQNDSGEWSGISIDLWTRLAEELGLQYTLESRELEQMIEDTAAGRVDLAVGALTVTHDREERLDFSHPFYTTGLGIAVGAEGSMFIGLARALFSPAFLTALASLLLILLIAGGLIWLFERRRNRDQFGGTNVAGLGNGLWWAAVTMTTVGYGDKVPVTLGGRIVALVWMYASVIIISFFTAGIATSLTVGSLRSGISGPMDLTGASVGTVGGSTGETFARQNGADIEAFDDVQAAVRALARGDLEAVVYDKSVLKYYVEQSAADEVQLLDGEWDRQSYAIAMPEGSALREPLNQALLSILESPSWTETVERYLGSE